MAKKLKLGRAINGPKMSLLDHLFCKIGIHTYSSVYAHYDETKQSHPFDAYYSICICGHGRSEEHAPLIWRKTKTKDGWYDPHIRRWNTNIFRKRTDVL